MTQIEIPLERAIHLVEKDTNSKFFKFENNIFFMNVSDDKIFCFKCKKYVSEREYHSYLGICLDCIKKSTGG